MTRSSKSLSIYFCPDKIQTCVKIRGILWVTSKTVRILAQFSSRLRWTQLISPRQIPEIIKLPSQFCTALKQRGIAALARLKRNDTMAGTQSNSTTHCSVYFSYFRLDPPQSGRVAYLDAGAKRRGRETINGEWNDRRLLWETVNINYKLQLAAVNWIMLYYYDNYGL